MSPQVADSPLGLHASQRLLGKELCASCRSSVHAVSAENEGRAAKGNASAVPQRHSPYRLSLNERTVCGAKVDKDDVPVLDPDLGVMARDSLVDQPQVTVRAAAQDR